MQRRKRQKRAANVAKQRAANVAALAIYNELLRDTISHLTSLQHVAVSASGRRRSTAPSGLERAAAFASPAVVAYVGAQVDPGALH